MKSLSSCLEVRHRFMMHSSPGRNASGRTFRIQLVVLLLLASFAEVRSHVDCNSDAECTPSNVSGCVCGCYDGGNHTCPTKASNGWGGICHAIHVDGINYGIDKGNGSFYCPERPCPSGTFNNVSTCVQGGIGRGGGTECSCTTCPVDTYSIAVGASANSTCSTCPPNSNSPAGSAALTNCTCNAGSTGPNGGPCTACAAGKYSNVAGATSPTVCVDCGAGTYSLAGASACVTCDAGSPSELCVSTNIPSSSSTSTPLPASTTTTTPAATATTTPAPATPATPTPSAVTSKLTLTTELTPQQQVSVKSAYWWVLWPVAQVRMENVEMRKDTYQVSDNITLVSYIVTVYVDDAAAAVAVTTRLTDTAGLKTAFIAAGLNASVVDKALFAPPAQVVFPSATTDGASLFSVLHGDCNGTMPVKCATNYTGEELRARYQRCGKDRCGGPACTATEPVFATGGTGNNMPPEDAFEVWVIVCHKRTKECHKFFPSRHDLSVCV